MNILLSAYACEPNKGSEPGVGWSWAIEISKYHKVWVITRANNEPVINSYMKEHPEYKNDNLHFIYIKLPKKLTFWKKGRRGMRLFYMMWQYKAAKVAKQWHKKVCFDLVQHVTFVSYTQPTYMYKLGIPMILGPISGGENIPDIISVDMNKKEQFVEYVRKLSQKVALITPSICKTMKKSKYILVATEETKDKIPADYQSKTIIMPAIGIEKFPEINSERKQDEKIRIIMVGRIISWKAFDLGIKAFLKIVDKYPNLQLHILGEGNRKLALKKLAGKYLDKQIFFETPVPHDDIYKFYQGFDIFLNTTLRDSGCMTMMEAMSVGLPCICIATGGPKVLSESIPYSQVIPQENEKLIEELKIKIEKLILDRSLMKKQIRDTREACKKFTIESKVNELEKMYDSLI